MTDSIQIYVSYNNKDKVKEQAKTYYEANKERILKQKTLYRATKKDLINII